MADTLFSASWFRVAGLKPYLHRHAVFHRHRYRGRVWHVVEDRTAESYHRFPPATYYLIGLMDGERTVDAIWRAAVEKLGDKAPSQDEVIHLLVQLSAANLIKTQTTAASDDLFRRYRAIGQQSWLTWLNAPFSLRLPLLNPDRLLDAVIAIVRPVFTIWGLIAWMAVIMAGCVVAAINWGQITQNIADRLLAPWNLAAVALAYILLKIVHEAGHALAVKAWGGRVQDVGLMFVVFMPIPYVDASAASAFPSKWRRATVDAAGIMVELLAAAVAVLFWVQAEPGPLRSFLYNIMLIGTGSTLLFNGNPLLRFDGYYLLADLLEIPNLGPRAQAYLGHLVERFVAGGPARDVPVSTPGERFWFSLYAPLSGAYRVFISVSIALILASQYAVVGALLGVWALVLMVLLPVARALRSFVGKGRGERRGRLIGIVGGATAAVVAFAFLLPLPSITIAKGVAIVPDRGSVRAGAEGFVAEVLARPNAVVATGTPLLRVNDPTVDAEMKALKSQLAALKAKLDSVDSGITSAVEAASVREDIKSVDKALGRETLRKAEQTMVAPTDGVFRFNDAADITGRFLQRGETVGFVQDPARLLVTAMLDQVGFGEVQNHLRRVSLWAEGLTTRPFQARVAVAYPGGGTTLPSAPFSVEGGGDFQVDPHRPGELHTLTNVFRIDVEALNPPPEPALIGQHYLVRFESDPEPVGWQFLRAGRRLLLDRFGL